MGKELWGISSVGRRYKWDLPKTHLNDESEQALTDPVMQHHNNGLHDATGNRMLTVF